MKFRSRCENWNEKRMKGNYVALRLLQNKHGITVHDQ